jgi:hypothetical protein
LFRPSRHLSLARFPCLAETARARQKPNLDDSELTEGTRGRHPVFVPLCSRERTPSGKQNCTHSIPCLLKCFYRRPGSRSLLLDNWALEAVTRTAHNPDWSWAPEPGGMFRADSLKEGECPLATLSFISMLQKRRHDACRPPSLPRYSRWTEFPRGHRWRCNSKRQRRRQIRAVAGWASFAPNHK